jgi:hypothetical protein
LVAQSPPVNSLGPTVALARTIRRSPMNIEQEIEILIRARYPLLYIVTSEELRVQQMLSDIAQRRQKKLFEWSCSTGIISAGTSIQSQKHRAAATKDPLLALDQVIDQVEPAIFLFKDLHPFLTKSNFAVTRKLKEIALHLKNSFKTILLVSPTLEIPTELEKELTVLHFPLPALEDLSDLLGRILEEVREFKQVQIDLDPAGRERLLQAALGLTLTEAENVFAKILIRNQRLSGDDVGEVFAQKQQVIRKNGLLEYCSTDETFANVGGVQVLKNWLAKRALAFTAEARAFGLPAPKGILLLGVQGCGKSLCAKAVSSQWQLPLLRFDIGRMFGSFVGSSEENIRRAIAVAESIAPTVLWWTKSIRPSPAHKVQGRRTAVLPLVFSAPSSPGFRRRTHPCSLSPRPMTFRICRPSCCARADSTRFFSSTCQRPLNAPKCFAFIWPSEGGRQTSSRSTPSLKRRMDSAVQKSNRPSSAHFTMRSPATKS